MHPNNVEIFQVMKSITDELVKISNAINVEKRNRDDSE